MQDKLRLLHRFLNEIMHASEEDALNLLLESYQEQLDSDDEDDIVAQLFQDVQMLGKENLFLKTCGTDLSRNRKLAALTAEERTEFAEVGVIIDENRFGYHFQPIVSAADGSIYSYEALMRPVSEMKLTPFHILKYAELTGRLNDIESATFLNVLGIIDEKKEVLQERKVFINSIPKMKLYGSDFKRVSELLMKHSDTAVVEITEQTESDDEELNALKERYLNMGVKIAIDDYGTGYSNVQNLLRYMPNYVKIDRSLISDIQNNAKKRHFVREIIEFCHGNGIMALAEGVETTEELRTVILLGTDLIQGYYTARPAFELIDAIPYEIRQEIKLYQQERQDGRDQQMYAASNGERIQLDKLVREDYRCILADADETGDSEITIIGSPNLDTEVHIEAADNFKGRIILENVHLSNVKNRPCIELGEHSDVTLVIRGENKLNKSGIRVPEGARFTLEGEGMLAIQLDAAEYFAVGNDMKSAHGDLVFNQKGIVRITARGRMGVCIGSGLGGNIAVRSGKIALNVNGFNSVGIGAMNADSSLEFSNCAIDADVSFMKGVAVGSLTGCADVRTWKSSTKIIMSGEEIAAFGTISGERAVVIASDAVADMNLRGTHSTCVGSLYHNTELRVENASFRASVVGEHAVPFGSTEGDMKVFFSNADTSVTMETGVDMDAYLASDNLEVIGGRYSFVNRGREIVL